MDREKAILTATQFFRFWKYEWILLNKEQTESKTYVPNSDHIATTYEELADNALKLAQKSKDKTGEAETGRLLVTCIIHEDGPYFEYYISAD